MVECYHLYIPKDLRSLALTMFGHFFCLTENNITRFVCGAAWVCIWSGPYVYVLAFSEGSSCTVPVFT